MDSEIKRWGNSAAVRLPGKILAQADLDVTSPVTVSVEQGRIVIEPAETNSGRKLRLPFSEAELVEGLDAHGAHADEVAPPLADEWID